MLRGVVCRVIESLASKGHSSIWKLMCAISVCNTLTVGVNLSSIPSTSGPGSATDLDVRDQSSLLLFHKIHCGIGLQRYSNLTI